MSASPAAAPPAPARSSPTPAVSVRSIALPAEHGGWGLLGEPLVLGLLLAPSHVSLGIAVLAFGAFLARHPLKLALADRRRGTRHPRTAVAERFFLAYSAAAAVGALMAWGAPPVAWLPLVVAAPLGLLQLAYDSDHKGRQLVPELLGAAALACPAAAMVLAAGWTTAAALVLAALLAAKAIGSVLYVRARLRRDRGLAAGAGAPLAAHAAAFLGALVAAWTALGPALAVAAFAMLLGRAAAGLSGRARQLPPKQVGFRELAYGVATTALLAAGYGLRL